MKKTIRFMALAVILFALLTSCSEADMVNANLSKQAT